MKDITNEFDVRFNFKKNFSTIKGKLKKKIQLNLYADVGFI